MRGYIPLLLALSASCTTVAALPKPRMQLRDSASKPKYSVVPLEPGNDDPSSDGTGGEDGNGGSGSGGEDENGGDVVTVIQTVVQTRKPVTQVITQTGKPSIITVPGKTITRAVPTTVSIINLDDQPVVTQTVTISHPSASTSKKSGKPTATKEPETAESQAVTTAQEPSDSLTSAAAPGVTSQPQPNPQPQPQPQPEPEPEPSTIQIIQTPSTPETQSVIIQTVTVTQTSSTSESWLATQVPESTAAPSSDSPVAPIPPQETFVPNPTSNEDESWSSITTPYEPPVVPTTLLTSCITTTTTSDYQHVTPEPAPSLKTHDDGAWHTTYPAWNGNDLAM
ncbi:hypothetical protein EDB82DRAFT_521555 [Fusarium venenatum]|uniref:uncharacterized protein n=1 Tax=Fusarium venenatum TaxID=56646 RepID=UPI001D4A8B37|nr:hypothetical protein EDB82DRAFT_521555 [Fusarium venenatum]